LTNGAASLTVDAADDEDVVAERKRIEAPQCSDVVRATAISKVRIGIMPASHSSCSTRAASRCGPSTTFPSAFRRCFYVAYFLMTGRVFWAFGRQWSGQVHDVFPPHRSVGLDSDSLAGETPVTSGAAAINGFDVYGRHADACRYMGFCPQFDGLICA
jgi:hypothetical protein